MSQTPEIIGRGTWLDKVASEVLAREDALGRDTAMIRVESGLGASGLPHIGSVGDAIRSYGAKLALETAGHDSQLIAYSDDFDGLRKVPKGFPAWLKDYLAHPVSKIPDPFGCHASYAEHVGSLLRDSLDRIGIEYVFQSGTEAYRSGLLGPQISKILESSEAVGRKIKELVGQNKYEETLPYTPVCANCGRIYTTRALSYDPGRRTVAYKCAGTELGDGYLEGCGHEGEASIDSGEGKLMWKVEFAARWAAFDIRFEAYGKELTDSVKINDWVSENVLGFHPPYHARYELFQDKTGKKLSKSSGNLITPQEWLTYASPESLRLLMFKRIIGARNISTEDIPTYMEEFDDLEAAYFSKRRDPNHMKDAKQRGLYEYSVLLRVPRSPGVHVPYRLVAQLAAVAPPGAVREFVAKRLVAYGLVKERSPQLDQRIDWAAAWAEKGGPRSFAPPVIGGKVAVALKSFADGLAGAMTADDVQGLAFQALRAEGLKPAEFFSAVYSVLIGSDRGPRLGPYVMDASPAEVRRALLGALGETGK
jgi:lysyl-tRNA synthetase, class I